MNADNYYCGDESGEVFDNWGSTGYCCTFTSGKFRFTVNYTPAWASWSGYALSSRSETTYNTLTPDQFNACTGSGYGGTGHFLVVFTFGERIEVLGNPEGEEVPHPEGNRDFPRAGQQVPLGHEIIFLRGPVDYALVEGTLSFRIKAGIHLPQLFRQHVLPGEAHPLEQVAQGEDRAAGLLAAFAEALVCQ